MKAVFIEHFGGPEVLQYGELPDPAAAQGEVVVDVVAASVNGADWKVRSGQYKQTAFPLILGRDFSGFVGAVGEDVADLAVGDAVFGVLDAGREGTYAEKLGVNAAIIAKKPADLPHVSAAALALAGLTALSAVEDTLKLKSGETILVQGGAGGVASFAVQLAKYLGAHVITTARAANHAYLREQKSFAVLKPGGRAAFVASGPQAPKPDRGDVQALRPAVGRARRPLERIAELFTAGAIRAPQIKLYRLSEAADAHRLSESRHFRGKLVFQVR
jgi:NADPH:quinone reductase-like Zn-dependent oxidoreductase